MALFYRNPNDVKPGMRLTVRNECVTVQPNNPVAQPSLTIKTPKPGDSLGSTFIVTGTGAALPQGLVVVRALDAAGKELAKMTVALAADSTPARAGTWYAQLNVSVRSSGPGYIEATVPGAEVRRTVVIQYQAAPAPETGGGGSQGSTVVFYRQGQCQVRPAKDAAVYEYPNGLVKGDVSDALVEVTQRVVDAASSSWYQIADPYAAPNPGYWVKRENLAFVGVGCN